MDNIVGSLTQYQKSIIIGLILGDGYLRRIQGRKHAFLEVNHAISQKEYVDWKFNSLTGITNSSPVSRKGKEKRIAYRFYTKQHPYLTKLWYKFYSEKYKVIPNNLKLNSLTLAVWYMDDGSKCGRTDVYLNTQQFKLKDQLNLIKSLEGLGLKSKLNKDKEYYRIRLLKESLFKFKHLISPYILSSMKYKIEL